ncbi:MAG: inositol monophosphatase family protein, partial [Nocardioides sp.]
SAGRSGVRWVVDPIDGTVNFVSGFPEYAVSIGAELDGEAIAGAVVHVPTGTAFAASLGCGAHRDGRPIDVRSGQPLAESLIATGFNYRRDVRTMQAAAAARLLPHIGDIRRTGSCAMDLAHVAEGSLGGYLEEGVHPWDHSAGGLIAREAGARTGQTTGAGGLDLFLCAPAERFEELWELAEECGFFA